MASDKDSATPRVFLARHGSFMASIVMGKYANKT